MRSRRAPLKPLVVLALAGASGCFAYPSGPYPGPEEPVVAAAPAGPLEAGAAWLDVTPRQSVWMAGFGFLKASAAVHDPLGARAIALRRGDVTVVIVGVDALGLHLHTVERARRRLAAWHPEATLLVAATHTHAGPDTLGLWGLPPLISGIEAEVLDGVVDGVVGAALAAIADLAPARATWGQVQAPPHGVSRNRRDPELIDRTVTALGFDRPDGTPVATLVQFACHPESLGSANRVLSADFPAALYRTVSAARGGAPTVFLNGALGGMVTTDEEDETFAEADRIGRAVGELALAALADGTPFPAAVPLGVSRRRQAIPVENWRYRLADLFGVFGGRPFADGYTDSEVTALRLGPLTLATLPGEPLPRVGFELQADMPGEVRLVVGLGNDELGYLIHEDDWAARRYPYERTVSAGPHTVPLLRAAARAALADLDAAPADGGPPR